MGNEIVKNDCQKCREIKKNNCDSTISLIQVKDKWVTTSIDDMYLGFEEGMTLEAFNKQLIKKIYELEAEIDKLKN
jgi:hypothetical protein